MKIHGLILLKWKSFVRHPLFEQMIMIRLLLDVYLLSLLYYLYLLGSFITQFVNRLLREKTSYLNIIYILLLAFTLDFALKFLFKKTKISQFFNFFRFYEGKKNIYLYIILSEFFNLWNYYLLVFFFTFLIKNIYPNFGLLITVFSAITLCIIQILISLWVGKLKSNNNEVKFLSIFASGTFPVNILSNYLLLSTKMMIRSPRLRQQLLVYLLLTISYLFIIQNKISTNSFFIQLLFITIFISLFPILFNQFLFSAEASFFDCLMITPNFKKILTAKYILSISLSGLSFFLLLFLQPFTMKNLIMLMAVLFYSAGPITLFSFCSILFVDTKMDLFGPFYKIYSNTQSTQAFIVFLTFLLSISFMFLIERLFSTQVVIYFMMFFGIIFILFNQLWIDYLYKYFYLNKYGKMEIFRKQ